MRRLTNSPSELQHTSQPVKQRRSRRRGMTSNPLRNSRSKTHRNDEGAATLAAPLLHRCDRSSMPEKRKVWMGSPPPFTVPFVKIFEARFRSTDGVAPGVQRKSWHALSPLGEGRPASRWQRRCDAGRSLP
jgi:hypothetical protein